MPGRHYTMDPVAYAAAHLVGTERDHQIDKGYTVEHDMVVGPEHLAELAMERLIRLQRGDLPPDATQRAVLRLIIEAAALTQALLEGYLRASPELLSGEGS